MAYVLGFFTADGCLTINPRGSHYIEFTNNDIDVLEKIREALQSKHKIGNKTKNKINQKNGYRLQVGNQEMFKDLKELGFMVRKSKIIQMPRVPYKFFPDFLRGYFDGDGCISYGKYKYKDRKSKKFHILIRFICYNKIFLEQLSIIIEKLIKTKGKTIFYHERAYSLAYSVTDSLKIINKMYKIKGIWMDRKYNSCKKALKMYNDIKNSKISI